jgi:hypothetical protein
MSSWFWIYIGGAVLTTYLYWRETFCDEKEPEESYNENVTEPLSSLWVFIIFFGAIWPLTLPGLLFDDSSK